MKFPKGFLTLLYQQGYRRDFRVRGRSPMVCYKKSLQGFREVEVQLWGDGDFRATHSIKGCSKTAPTEFKTLEQMRVALALEETRTDGFKLEELHA